MLKYKHAMLLSTILDKVEAKTFFEYLERKLVKIDDSNKGKLQSFKGNEQDKLEYSKELKKQKDDSAMLEVFGFVGSKLHIVDPELKEFFFKTKQLTPEQVEDMEIKTIVTEIKEMFEQTMPDFVKEKISDNLKKTLSLKT